MDTSIFGSEAITLADSLYITLISMGIVFFILIIISTVLSFFKYIPAPQKAVKTKRKNVEKKEIKDVKEPQKRFDIADIKDETMQVAMMVASIEASKDNEDSYIRVISIKELN